MEEGEEKNGEMIWLREALTSCCVLSGDLCALARAIHRYGTEKRWGQPVSANLGARVHAERAIARCRNTRNEFRSEWPIHTKLVFIS
jgi:hypothetical protein